MASIATLTHPLGLAALCSTTWLSRAWDHTRSPHGLDLLEVLEDVRGLGQVVEKLVGLSLVRQLEVLEVPLEVPEELLRGP